MTVVLVGKVVKEEDTVSASEEYGDYIKVVADVKTGAVTIGGEWHADGERLLLENGSQQEDLWGGGISISNHKIDYNSLINIRPSISNDSMEILNQEIQDKFKSVVQDKFGL